MLKRILNNLGYIRSSGRINWGEIGFDIVVVCLLFTLFVVIGVVV